MAIDAKTPQLPTDPKIADVAGVILAGGKSLRYGTNKAFVEVEGIPLIERVFKVMDTLFEEVILITNTPNLYSYLDRPMFEDIYKGKGPMGGLLTALSVLFPRPGFIVACDMPTLNADLIRHMVTAAEGFDIVVPMIGHRFEALHALYGPACLAPVKQLVSQNTLQIIRLFEHVSVRYVKEDELRRFDPQLASFFNINSPLEVERLMRTKGRQAL